MSNQCKHGQLARQCPICELQGRVAGLEAENAQIRDQCEKAATYISDLAPKSDHLMGELNHVAWHFHEIARMGLNSEGE